MINEPKTIGAQFLVSVNFADKIVTKKFDSYTKVIKTLAANADFKKAFGEGEMILTIFISPFIPKADGSQSTSVG